jgi:cell wall assembly regulator SMI1
VDPIEVERLEDGLGLKLPEGYREVLLHHDGQIAESCQFRTATGRVVRFQFLTLGNSILRYVAANAEGDFEFLKGGLVPIGKAPGQAGAVDGWVYLDDREVSRDPPVSFVRLGVEEELLADSFAAFVDSLFDP